MTLGNYRSFSSVGQRGRAINLFLIVASTHETYTVTLKTVAPNIDHSFFDKFQLVEILE